MSEREFAPEEFQGHEALIAELRAGTLGAPGHLHQRVLAGPPAKQRQQRVRNVSTRRRGFLVLPVAASLAVGAALVHGAFFSGPGSKHPAALAAGNAPVHGASRPSAPSTSHGPSGGPGPTGPQSGTGSTTGVFSAARSSAYQSLNHRKVDSLNGAAWRTAAGNDYSVQAQLGEPVLTPNSVNIPTNRHVHAAAALDVLVPNSRALTNATNRATQIVTNLGGYTESSQINASGKSGSGDGGAFLSLRVPVGKAEVAITRLGALGQVAKQQVSTKDLQQRFTQQVDTIGTLRRTIAIYQQSLQSGTLTGSQRVDIEVKLANAEHVLAQTRQAHSRTAAYAATTDISLTLSTNKHAFALPPAKRGRLGRLLHNAGAFLALEGVIVLYILIVGAPIALLLALAWWLPRQRRQREERRLLASA